MKSSQNCEYLVRPALGRIMAWQRFLIDKMMSPNPLGWVLRDRIITECNKISQWFLHNTFLSIRQCCQAIIRSNGCHTRD